MTTLFNSPTTRIPRSKDVPVWDAKLNQWIPTAQNKITPIPVTQNGLAVTTPKIDAGLSGVFTSVGAFNYTQNLGVAFTAAPEVVITLLNPSTGSSTFCYLTSRSTTSFAFATGLTTPIAVFPIGATFQVEWIAVGH